MAEKAAGIPSPSLPQKDNPFERAEREAQLFGSRKIYEYSNATGLPMPMAAARAAIVQLPELGGWIEGQGINQAKIFADLGIWKLETSGSPGFSSFADYAKVFTIFEAPDIVDTWQDDRIFASQRVAGLNPMTLNLVTADGSAGMGWGYANLTAAYERHDYVKDTLAPSSLRYYRGTAAGAPGRRASRQRPGQPRQRALLRLAERV